MDKQVFIGFVEENVALGSDELAYVTKRLLYKRREDLFDKLDFYDHDIFLEPLLFAYFTGSQSDFELDQILFGYINGKIRPNEIDVYADSRGIVYLPAIGYLRTSEKNQTLRLKFNKQTNCFSLRRYGEPVNFNFEEIFRLKGTAIELCRSEPLLLDRFFTDPKGNATTVDVETAVSGHAGHIELALEIIQTCCPNYYACILAATKKIIVYTGEHPHSFANIGAHGIAFLNARSECDEVFFVEDIIHQCGHVIFNAITVNKSEYIRIDPMTPLSTFNPNLDYDGAVYGAFHGLFTQTNINECLNTIYERNVFSGRKKHELQGRISDDMKRFRTALAFLDHKEIYTDKGWELYKAFRESYARIFKKRRELIQRLDTSNQPYIFSYEKFSKENPLGEMEESARCSAGLGSHSAAFDRESQA